MSLNKKKRMTLRDVAARAGVSVQTASHVLSGNMSVRLPETTRSKVRVAASELGYQPNRIAQAMKTGRSNMISLWMPIDRMNPSYSRSLNTISKLSGAKNYDLMIVGLESSQAYSLNPRIPHQWPVDGLLALDCGRAMRYYRENSTDPPLPLVVMGHELLPGADAVSWDVYGASYAATKQLIERGRKNILHLSLQWVLDGFPQEQRRRGYTDAMEEAGLEPKLIGIESEELSTVEREFEQIYSSAKLPDAILCFTDSIALGVSRVLYAHGLRDAKECELWGFGDFPEASEARIPINTFRNPSEAVAEQAWNWLLERIADPNLDSRFLLLPMDQIIRS